ncbi:hypothetical protein JCM12141A_55910 [Mycolicibacterium hodleri]
MKSRRPGHLLAMTDKDEQTEDHTDAADPPPGPADHGRTGGMATREVAPDVVKRSGDATD